MATNPNTENPHNLGLCNAEPNIYKVACESRYLLSRIGDKWSVMVLLLLNHAPERFGSIKRACEGVSQKMLTQTLRQLEADQLLTRTVLQDKPLQVEYALTQSGLDLAQLVTPLVHWVHHHYPNIVSSVTTPHSPGNAPISKSI